MVVLSCPRRLESSVMLSISPCQSPDARQTSRMAMQDSLLNFMSSASRHCFSMAKSASKAAELSPYIRVLCLVQHVVCMCLPWSMVQRPIPAHLSSLRFSIFELTGDHRLIQGRALLLIVRRLGRCTRTRLHVRGKVETAAIK